MTKAVRSRGPRPPLGRPAVVIAILAAALATAAPVMAALLIAEPAAAARAAAAATGGIELAVEPSSSAYPEGAAPLLHVRLENLADTSCSLASTSELTLAVLEASRDGQPLVPTYARSLPIDGAAATVAARATSVAAHAELVFDIDTDGEDALVTSIALPDGSMLSALYPLAPRGAYQLRLAYAMPPSSFAGDSPTACTGMSEPVTVAFTVGGASTGGLPWYLVGLASAVLVALAVVALLLRRRGKRRGPRAAAGAVALLLLALAGAVAVAGTSVQPAAAGIVYGPDPNKNKQIYDTYLGCIGKIGAFDPGLITALNNVNVVVFPWTDSETKGQPGGGSFIKWDPFGGTGFVGETSGATYDPCAGLYHELNHARDHAEGKDSNQYCGNTGVLLDEVRATIAENRYRAAQQPPLKPRTTYDGKKIPSTMDGCTPPKKAENDGNNPGVCRGIDGPCGGHTGDPHVSTFDGYRFDFQAVGEFVAVRSSAGDLEIQVRQTGFPGTRVVSVNTAVALRVGETRLGFYLDQGRVAVHRDGAAVVVPVGTSELPGGAKVNYVVDPSGGDSFAIVWPDGSAAWVVEVGRWGLTLAVQPRAARTGTLTGLLGPFDGDPANEVSTADGQALPQPPSFDDLYSSYGPGWRVSDASSLFDYADGTGTEDFTDLTFPDRLSTSADLSPERREAARAACTLLGVVDAALVEDCVLDVGFTGQAMFAVNSLRLQVATASGPVDGSGSNAPTQTATVDDTTITSIDFDATAGQRAYVEVVETSLPDSCGVPELVSPAGTTLAIGCLREGAGSIDATALPVTGRYQVVIRPRSGVTGTITVRVILSVDAIGPITPDGPAGTLAVDTPGQVARLNFTATAGQKLFLDIVSSTLASGCGVFALATAGDGRFIAIGCTGPAGDGVVDTTTIQSAGTYSVVLDPPGTVTGTATVRLSLIEDQHQAIVLNGPAVFATVSEAGAQSLLTFSGAAGQTVTVEATGASEQLVGCGAILLRDPGGYTIDFGCVSPAGSGVVGPTTLPISGTFTVAVDPGERRTGSVTLRLRS